MEALEKELKKYLLMANEMAKVKFPCIHSPSLFTPKREGESCRYNDNCAYPYCSPAHVEPEWVCFDCAKERGARTPENHICTVHNGICGICGEFKSVTEPRDFGFTRSRLRVKGKIDKMEVLRRYVFRRGMDLAQQVIESSEPMHMTEIRGANMELKLLNQFIEALKDY